MSPKIVLDGVLEEVKMRSVLIEGDFLKNDLLLHRELIRIERRPEHVTQKLLHLRETLGDHSCIVNRIFFRGEGICLRPEVS